MLGSSTIVRDVRDVPPYTWARLTTYGSLSYWCSAGLFTLRLPEVRILLLVDTLYCMGYDWRDLGRHISLLNTI